MIDKLSLSKFKDELVEPIHDLLSNYNINFYEANKDDLKNYGSDLYGSLLKGYGYLIRNGEIQIKQPLTGGFNLSHELAHIVLINNFDKLLIDNWGMPALKPKFSIQTRTKWLLCMEARVWGIENFLLKDKRNENGIWLDAIIPSKPKKKLTKLSDRMEFKRNSDEKYNELSNKVNDVMLHYENAMTLDIFLNKLKDRLDFVKEKISNNNNFNSTHFDLE